MRIGASQQVAIFLENERRVKLGGSGHYELRRRSHSVEQRARTHCRERLTRAAVRAENIVCRNATAAETAIDRLHLDRLAAQHRRGHTVTHASRHQLLEMYCELVAQFARGAE